MKPLRLPGSGSLGGFCGEMDYGERLLRLNGLLFKASAMEHTFIHFRLSSPNLLHPAEPGEISGYGAFIAVLTLRIMLRSTKGLLFRDPEQSSLQKIRVEARCGYSPM